MTDEEKALDQVIVSSTGCKKALDAFGADGSSRI
jgi:hypothetical protein